MTIARFLMVAFLVVPVSAQAPAGFGLWRAADLKQHDAALAEFNLAAAIGRLIAPELRLPVQLYDMERHYRGVKDKLFGFGGGLKE